MTRTRDIYIDVVKGVMLLSVINIHTVYWSLAPYTPGLARELAYFVDIPIFFFISGYLMRHDGFLTTTTRVLRQFIRLFLQYVAVSLLVAGGILIWVYLADDRLVGGLQASLLDILRVHLTGELWGYLKGYYGSLWYIRVYFSMMLFLPLLIGAPYFERLKVHTLLFLLFAYSLSTYQYDHHYFLLGNWGEISFYLFFFVLGAVYRSEEVNIRMADTLVSLAAVILLCVMIFHFDGNELRLSRYKFPPSYQYLVYSLPLVHVFILIKTAWRAPSGPFIRQGLRPLAWIGRNSYIVYLFQGAACSIPYYFAASLEVSSTLLLWSLVYGFNVSTTIVMTSIYLLLARSLIYVRQGVTPLIGRTLRLGT